MLAITAALYAELGDLAEARPLATQVPPLVREIGLHGAMTRLGLFAEELGILDDLRDAVAAGAGPRAPLWRERDRAHPGRRTRNGRRHHGLGGEPDDRGEPPQARGSPAAGRRSDRRREVELEQALAFYRSVDASAYVAQIESALAGAQSESA